MSIPGHEILRFQYLKVELKKQHWRRFIDSTNPGAAALLAKMAYTKDEKRQVRTAFLRKMLRLRKDLDDARVSLIYLTNGGITLTEIDNPSFKNIEDILGELSKEKNTKINIALFGQPGSGKSSIINAIIGENVAEVSTRTDTTTEEGSIIWGEDDSLLLTDLPGFGTSQFPANDYWQRFSLDKYDLFVCVFSGKFHQADDELFNKIIEKGKPCIFVRNYSDTLFDTKRIKTKDELKVEIREALEQRYGEAAKLIFTSCVTGEGIGELIEEIENRLSTSKRAKWERNAKAYSIEFLMKKKAACKKLITLTSAAAAANGLNPIPGLNIAIDIGILQKMFTQIRKSFDLSEDKLKSRLHLYPHLANVVNNLLKSVSTHGVISLLEKQAGKVAAQQLSKYIPFIGQAISASAGFGITYLAGNSYLDNCYEVAEAMLKEDLNYAITE
ncbi:GTPase [Paenibacillus agricola]|nr:GTPase [Paenibacillus agricola]